MEKALAAAEEAARSEADAVEMLRRELTESRKKIDETTEELARATGTGPEDEAARWLKQARKNPLTPPVLLILEDMLGKVAGPDAVLNYRKANVSDGRLVLENVAVEGRMGLQGPLVIDQVILTTVAGDEGGGEGALALLPNDRPAGGFGVRRQYAGVRFAFSGPGLAGQTPAHSFPGRSAGGIQGGPGPRIRG